MADPAEQAAPIEDEEPEETPGYKPPAQKTLEEIQQLDADDESLARYKQMLLAGAADSGDWNFKNDQFIVHCNCPTKYFYWSPPCIVPFSVLDDGGPNVVVQKMSVLIGERPDIELDLTGLYQNLAHDKA